jgi:hypothetical protein
MRRSTCSGGIQSQPLARLDRGAREDQPLDRSGDQLLHRLRHRQIGLAGARRSQREDHVARTQRAHVFDLHGRSRHDRFLARADHDRRGVVAAGDDAFQRRFTRHHDQRFDRADIKFLALGQPLVHALEDIARAGHRLFRAFDLDAVAARRDVDAQAVLDLDEIGVELAE